MNLWFRLACILLFKSKILETGKGGLSVLPRYIFLVVLTLFVTSASFAQSQADRNDPRQMALDVFSGIERGTEPATIALSVRRIVELFRYRCTRVTDYQVFARRPNITDLKVKCSGDPLYGVTVASNGFVTVYGGNSILAGMDRRDAVIYSFDAEGTVDDTSGFDFDRLREETELRATLGGEYDYVYLGGMLMILLGFGFLMLMIFIRLWRKRQRRRRKPRSRMKPMQKFKVGLSSEVKERLITDSEEIANYVHQHESGLVIAVGKRGKRRVYLSPFWGKMYARYGINMFEASEEALSQIDLSLLDEAEMVAEGEEVTAPRG